MVNNLPPIVLLYSPLPNHSISLSLSTLRTNSSSLIGSTPLALNISFILPDTSTKYPPDFNLAALWFTTLDLAALEPSCPVAVNFLSAALGLAADTASIPGSSSKSIISYSASASLPVTLSADL